MRSQRVGHDLVTEQQQMLVVRFVMRVVRGVGVLLGESHGQRSLVGHGPWGHKELDLTECLSTHTCKSSSEFGDTKCTPSS